MHLSFGHFEASWAPVGTGAGALLLTGGAEGKVSTSHPFLVKLLLVKSLLSGS